MSRSFTALLILTLPASVGALQQDPHSAAVPVLTVNGSAELQVAPDEALLQLGVEAEAQEAAAAQEQANRVAAAILRALKGLDIEERAIQTSGLRLLPVYSQPSPRSVSAEGPKVVGYRATNEVSARITDLTKVGPAIDATVGAGANRVIGVDFRLRDDREARRQALKDAIADAQAKARAMTEALGVPLGPVLEVLESGVSVQPIHFAAARMMRVESALADATPVSAGNVTINASVQVKYRIDSQ